MQELRSKVITAMFASARAFDCSRIRDDPKLILESHIGSAVKCNIELSQRRRGRREVRRRF